MRTIDIASNLYNRYASVEEVKHYYGVLAIYALVHTAQEQKDETFAARVRNILARFPDDIVHPRYNFPSYSIGGNARAYALFSGFMSDEHTSELVKKYADEMLNDAPKNKNGVLIMPGAAPADLTWIDVVTAATPYMLFAGLHFDRGDYIDFAIHQCIAMYDDLIDETGLLNQCRGFVAPGVKSQDHWSRGNGWGHIGFTELICHLPETHKRYDEVVSKFRDFCAALLKYQTEDGVWRQEITHPAAYKESSGSGLILYGFGAGVRKGVLDRDTYYPAFEKGVKSFPKLFINKDFSTELSCPGCLCPGAGAEKGTINAYISTKVPYRNEHHSFAPLMLALAEAHRLGITELEF